MKKLLLFLVFFVATPAFASSLVTPYQVFNTNSHLFVKNTGSNAGYIILFASNGRYLSASYVSPGDNYDVGYIGERSDPSSILGQIPGSWEMPDGIINSIFMDSNDPENNCLPGYDTATSESDLGTSPTQNLYEVCKAQWGAGGKSFYGQYEVWNGSSNGFFGSTTVGSLIATVASGTQTAGKAPLGMLDLVGIPLAFVLGGLMIYNIKQNAKMPKGKSYMGL